MDLSTFKVKGLGSSETSVITCHSIQPDIAEELIPIRAAMHKSVPAKIALHAQNDSKTLRGLRFKFVLK
jgi:hypothetical protein